MVSDINFYRYTFWILGSKSSDSIQKIPLNEYCSYSCLEISDVRAQLIWFTSNSTNNCETGYRGNV